MNKTIQISIYALFQYQY